MTGYEFEWLSTTNELTAPVRAGGTTSRPSAFVAAAGVRPSRGGGIAGKIPVVVAADIRLYREGLAAILPHAPQIAVVATAADWPQTFARVRELESAVDHACPQQQGLGCVPGKQALLLHGWDEHGNAARLRSCRCAPGVPAEEEADQQPERRLLKAGLIAGATRLAGDGAAGAVVDNHQGYGRVDLDGIIAPPAPASSRFTEVRPGLKTGQLRSSKLTVKSNGRPLRIALAWSDPPGPALVNNLNLIVTAPSGRKFVGNQRRNGPPTLDGINNAELVHVERPAAGVWKIHVVGSNVARGPQDFALVSIGHF